MYSGDKKESALSNREHTALVLRSKAKNYITNDEGGTGLCAALIIIALRNYKSKRSTVGRIDKQQPP